MPIYEYQCTVCGHELEAIQKFSDEPLKTCPECNKETLQKLMSAAGFQLKGTGWYATDFRDKGKPPAKNQTQDIAPKNDNSTESSDKPASSPSTTDKES
jgi:putative FmdB family regulatory protein